MPILNSSAIHSADYDPETKQLKLVFAKGNSYTYYNVPLKVYTELITARSAGTYFNDYIKDKYN